MTISLSVGFHDRPIYIAPKMQGLFQQGRIHDFKGGGGIYRAINVFPLRMFALPYIMQLNISIFWTVCKFSGTPPWEARGGGARGCAPPLIRQDVPQLKFSPRLPVVPKSFRIIIESMELYLWQVSVSTLAFIRQDIQISFWNTIQICKLRPIVPPATTWYTPILFSR